MGGMRTAAPREASLGTSSSSSPAATLAPSLQQLFAGLPGEEHALAVHLTNYEKAVALRLALLSQMAQPHAVKFCSQRDKLDKRDMPEGSAQWSKVAEGGAALHFGNSPSLSALCDFLGLAGAAVNGFPQSSFGAMAVATALQVQPGVADPAPHTLAERLARHERELNQGGHCSRVIFGDGGILSSASLSTVPAQGSISILLLRLLVSLAYSELAPFVPAALFERAAREQGLQLPIRAGQSREHLNECLHRLSRALQCVERETPLDVEPRYDILLGYEEPHVYCVFGNTLHARFLPIIRGSTSSYRKVISDILASIERYDRAARLERAVVGAPTSVAAAAAAPFLQPRPAPPPAPNSRAPSPGASLRAAPSTSPTPTQRAAPPAGGGGSSNSRSSSAAPSRSASASRERVCPNCKLPGHSPQNCEGQCVWEACPYTGDARRQPHLRKDHGNTSGADVRSATPGPGAGAGGSRVAFTTPQDCRNCGSQSHRSHECPRDCTWPGCPLIGKGPGGTTPKHPRAQHAARSSSTGPAPHGARSATIKRVPTINGVPYHRALATHIRQDYRLDFIEDTSLPFIDDTSLPVASALASAPLALPAKKPSSKEHPNALGLDPSVPYSAGSMPLLSSLAPHPFATDASGTPLQMAEGLHLWTGAGPTLWDQGCTVSVIAREALPGLQATMSTLPEHARVHVGGALGASSMTVAEVTITTDTAAQCARGIAAGLPPMVKPVGAVIKLLVFPQDQLRGFATSSFTPVCILGLDAQRNPAFSSLVSLINCAQLPKDDPQHIALWTHAQARAPVALPKVGTLFRHTSYGADFSYAVAHDHPAEPYATSMNPLMRTLGYDEDSEGEEAPELASIFDRRPSAQHAPSASSASSASSAPLATASTVPPLPHASSSAPGHSGSTAALPKANSGTAASSAARHSGAMPASGAAAPLPPPPPQRSRTQPSVFFGPAPPPPPPPPAPTATPHVRSATASLPTRQGLSQGDPSPPVLHLAAARAVEPARPLVYSDDTVNPTARGALAHASGMDTGYEGIPALGPIGHAREALPPLVCLNEATPTPSPPSLPTSTPSDTLPCATLPALPRPPPPPPPPPAPAKNAFASVAEVRDRLLQASSEPLLLHYVDKVAEVVYMFGEVFLPATLSDITLDVKIKGDGPPLRHGLRRTTPAELIAPLWAENLKLVQAGQVIERLDLAPDGGAPLDLHIHPYVLAIKKPSPGDPPGFKRVRFCLDCVELNKLIEDPFETVLPDTQDLLEQLSGLCAFISLDLASAFLQLRVPAHIRRLLGYSLHHPVTGARHYFEHAGAIFGVGSIPGLFSQALEHVLKDALEDNVRVRKPLYVDDLTLGAGTPPGAPSNRLPPIGSPECDEIVLGHLLPALAKTLHAFQRAKLRVNLAKSTFLAPSVSVLGIWTDGVTRRICPTRLQGWESLRIPGTISGAWLASFLGTINYCASFIDPSVYINLTQPLYELCTTCTRALKLALATADVSARRSAVRVAREQYDKLWTPAHADAARALIAHVLANDHLLFLQAGVLVQVRFDASNYGFGAQCGQYCQHTGVFRHAIVMSRRFTEAQRNWSVGARELYSVLCFMRRFWRQLAGHRLTFSTDHLNHLALADLSNAAVRRWATELLQWPDFTASLHHVRGEANILSDYLSRWCSEAPTSLDLASTATRPRAATSLYSGIDASTLPPPLHPRVGDQRLAVLEAPGTPTTSTATTTGARSATLLPAAPGPHEYVPTPFLKRVLAAQASLTEAQRAKLLATPKVAELQVQGLTAFFRGSAILVPASAPTDLIHDILSSVHGPATNHARLDKVRQTLLPRARVYLEGLEDSLRAYIASCPGCQQVDAPHAEREVHALIPSPVYSMHRDVFLDVAFLPAAERAGNDAFIGLAILVCPASRWAQFTPITSTVSSSIIPAMEAWASAAGRWPERAFTDGGAEFKKFFDAFCEERGILHVTGTPHNSKGRGIVERLVLVIKRALVALLPQGSLDQWPRALLQLEQAYNNTPHSSLANLSPFEYRFATPSAAPPGLDWLPPSAPTVLLDRLGDATVALRQLADICSSVSTLHSAATAPLDPLTFKVGDLVLLSLAHAHANRLSETFYHYQGPYRVTRVELNSRGAPTNFYEVCEQLANSTPDRPVLGPPRSVFSSRLWPWDSSRCDPVEAHLRRMPPGYGVVTEVVSGPSSASTTRGMYEVRWANVAATTFEHPSTLASLDLYKAYCASLREPPRQRPGSRVSAATPAAPATAASAAASAYASPSSASVSATSTPALALPHPSATPAAAETSAPLQAPTALFPVGALVQAAQGERTRPAQATVHATLSAAAAPPAGGYIVRWSSGHLSSFIPAAAVSALPAKRTRAPASGSSSASAVHH